MIEILHFHFIDGSLFADCRLGERTFYDCPYDADGKRILINGAWRIAAAKQKETP